MTDRSQFEAMLEALINEDQETAKELFHNIVVAKSREIYEELLESDFGKEEDKEDSEDDSEDSSEDDIGGDATDDLESDIESDVDDAEDDAEDIEGEDEDMEDRVQDLEDALEDLKSEFEHLMAGEHEEGEHDDMFGDEEEPEMGAEEPDMGDDMGGDMEDESMGGDKVTHVVHHNANDTGMPYESYASDEDLIREYVEKVGMDWDKAANGQEGKPVGAAAGSVTGATNTKSTVDNFKNDMGGTVANIAQGHVEVHGDAGMKSKVEGPGVMKPSVVPNPDAKGNINVPGGKAGKTGFKTQVKDGNWDKAGGANGKMAGAGTGGMGSQRGEQNTKPIVGNNNSGRKK
jgi:hypothetical protein